MLRNHVARQFTLFLDHARVDDVAIEFLSSGEKSGVVGDEGGLIAITLRDVLSNAVGIRSLYSAGTGGVDIVLKDSTVVNSVDVANLTVVDSINSRTSKRGLATQGQPLHNLRLSHLVVGRVGVSDMNFGGVNRGSLSVEHVHAEEGMLTSQVDGAANLLFRQCRTANFSLMPGRQDDPKGVVAGDITIDGIAVAQSELSTFDVNMASATITGNFVVNNVVASS